MRKLFIVFCLLTHALDSQNIARCKKRFDNFLNFRGSISAYVKFEPDVMYLMTAGGKKELAIYENEIPAIAALFEFSSQETQITALKNKGLRKFGKTYLDSLLANTSLKNKSKKVGAQMPLAGYRIAIDPGHFATTLGEAFAEKKYLYFLPMGSTAQDSVKIFESQLTFNTASLLKTMLESKGATVFLTRNKSDYTSFNCTYSEWLKTRKQPTLDSLMKAGTLSAAKFKALQKSNVVDFFWNFFRDYDLANRASKINAFDPDVTLIIHYNVDEKNVPWTKYTSKNYTMAFIPGAFTSDNLKRQEGKLSFLRLLLTDQLDRSEELARETVNNFHNYLGIEIARSCDATYLRDNCLSTNSAGVYCRNLALCRKINSPLVYGESLYQDNEKESKALMPLNMDMYGMKTNERLHRVATSYYDALLTFLDVN